MRSNIDHIAEYLKLRPTLSSLALFNTFYGHTDSFWLHERWRNKELLPCRLNTWCRYQVEDIRIERLGLKTITNPVQMEEAE